MTFTARPLDPPLQHKRRRGRPVVFAEAVFDYQGLPVAVFVRADAARAYAARLNRLMEQPA